MKCHRGAFKLDWQLVNVSAPPLAPRRDSTCTHFPLNHPKGRERMKPTFRSGHQPARGTPNEAHTGAPQSPAAASGLKRPGSPTPLAASERPQRLQRTGQDAAPQPRPICPENEAMAPQRPMRRRVSAPPEAGAATWQQATLAEAAGQSFASASLSRSLTPLPLDETQNLDPHWLSSDEADHLAALLDEVQPLSRLPNDELEGLVAQMLEQPENPSALQREMDIFPHALDADIVDLFRNARNLDLPTVIWTQSMDRPQSPGGVSDLSDASIGSPPPLSWVAPGLRGLSHQDVDDLIALFGQAQADSTQPIDEHGGLMAQRLARPESPLPLPLQQETETDIHAFDADDIVTPLGAADDIELPAGGETNSTQRCQSPRQQA